MVKSEAVSAAAPVAPPVPVPMAPPVCPWARPPTRRAVANIPRIRTDLEIVEVMIAAARCKEDARAHLG